MCLVCVSTCQPRAAVETGGAFLGCVVGRRVLCPLVCAPAAADNKCATVYDYTPEAEGETSHWEPAQTPAQCGCEHSAATP